MFAGVCLFCAYAACSSVICLFKCDYQLNYDFLKEKHAKTLLLFTDFVEEFGALDPDLRYY